VALVELVEMSRPGVANFCESGGLLPRQPCSSWLCATPVCLACMNVVVREGGSVVVGTKVVLVRREREQEGTTRTRRRTEAPHRSEFNLLLPTTPHRLHTDHTKPNHCPRYDVCMPWSSSAGGLGLRGLLRTLFGAWETPASCMAHDLRPLQTTRLP